MCHYIYIVTHTHIYKTVLARAYTNNEEYTHLQTHPIKGSTGK